MHRPGHATPRAPTFLPLAVAAAHAAERDPAAGTPVHARIMRDRAEAADRVAAETWTALLAGCDAPVRRVLPGRLRELTQATSDYLGATCWYRPGSPHRQRVTAAEARIADAVRDGDGAEFAEAFVAYDQAVATAVASVRGRASSPAR